MSDEVWPSHDRPRLRSSNGNGTEFKGYTRRDASGRFFATRWVTVAGLPLIPLERYYLDEGETKFESFGAASKETTPFQVHGRSHLRAVEILRTYVFCWLIGPAVVVAPLLLLVTKLGALVDAFSGRDWVLGALFGAYVVWLGGSIAAMVFLLRAYRARWAPLREVVWVDRPTPVEYTENPYG